MVKNKRVVAHQIVVSIFVQNLKVMRLFFVNLFFCISCISYSQIGLNFEETQLKFGTENIAKSTVNAVHYEVKRLSETETIKFNYNGEDIVHVIEVEDTETIDEARFHQLTEELNPNFMLTSSETADKMNVYYDSKNQFLNIKFYRTNDKSELYKIVFIADPKIISDLIPDIKKWR